MTPSVRRAKEEDELGRAYNGAPVSSRKAQNQSLHIRKHSRNAQDLYYLFHNQTTQAMADKHKGLFGLHQVTLITTHDKVIGCIPQFSLDYFSD